MSEMAPLALNEPTYLRVKRAIVGDIVAHHFKPGDHLTIEMLTTRYKVSHMPIREALRQLEGEGILVSLAHRGFRIESLSGRYIRNMYDLRAGLEYMMARRAASHATDAEIEDLREIHGRYGKSVRTGNIAATVEINIEFHDRIHAIADNPEAAQLIDARTRIVRTAAPSLDAFIRRDRLLIVDEHAAILAGLERKDPDACGRAMFDHLASARDRLIGRMIEAGLLEDEDASPR